MARREWLTAGPRPAGSVTPQGYCCTRGALEGAPAGRARSDRGDRAGRRRGRHRLQRAEAPADVHNTPCAFKPEKAADRQKSEGGQLADVRPNPARTRYLPAKGIRPPFRLLWHYSEKPLLEFPPIYARGVLYAVNNTATPSRSTPTPAKSSGNGGSAGSTPPLPLTRKAASTSSTWSLDTW